MKLNVILIGFMGSGKSTIGKKLADELGMEFVDMDELIQSTLNMSIKQIFQEQGEHAFREHERLLSKELRKKSNLVIATGGGVILEPQNMEFLSENGMIIYLKSDFKTIIDRIEHSASRPLYEMDNTENFRNLFRFREPLYQKYADYVIQVSNNHISSIVKKIKQKIKKNAK
ncbi:MAG: shikimate kinase [Candidatus Lokiarchaeota archaeon]|nr:shikimate kinase [Candidatus Lokiarchaeota archaeon]